jgi:hypothetical protein
MVGCENAAETGSVKYLSDDLKLECEGTEAGKARGCWPASACTCSHLAARGSRVRSHSPQICASRNPSSFPSFMGV